MAGAPGSPTCPGLPWSLPGPKTMGLPDFLYAVLDATACAAFFKESRMKCAGATKLHRKSGVAHDRICRIPQIELWVGKAFNRIYLLLQHRLLRDCFVSAISPRTARSGNRYS